MVANEEQTLDRISQLPDDLISHILSLIPQKEAVKTSVLSSGWIHLWLGIPNLELNSRDFSDLYTFKSFGDRFFHSTRASYIHKLNLTIDHNNKNNDDTSYLASWLDSAVKRKIQHLHVASYCYADRKFHKMPRRLLYNCETLVCLKLFQLTLNPHQFASSLPRLKTMHLEYIDFPNEATFETLFLCCPVLEVLKIVVATDDGKVFRVHSPSLKSLTFQRLSSFSFVSAALVIDAPRLLFLSIHDNVSTSFLVDNLDAATLELSVTFGVELDEIRYFDFGEDDDDDDDDEINQARAFEMRRSSIRSFLLGITMVTSMVISRDTFKLICLYWRLEPLPQFCYVSRLRISLFLSDFEWIPTFLESFPNLKSLILVCVGPYMKFFDEDDVSSPVRPAECLLSSLEFVEFIVPVWHGVEMELVKYLLKKSAILKKLTLALDPCSSRKADLFKKLLKIPRGSTKCKVVIH